MVTENDAKRYFMSVYKSGAIYLWGADLEVLTEDLLNKLKKTYGTSNYTRVSLELDGGKLGADCSGMLTPICGKNITAHAHYTSCKTKGAIAKMPKDKLCLIFRKENEKIVHVGVYMGDGTLIEMWNGCEHRKFIDSQWTYYGIPNWIKYSPINIDKDKLKVNDSVKLTEKLSGYDTAMDAINKKNQKTTLTPGTYYVYKIYNNSVNLTKKKGTAGSWVVL